MHHHFHRPRFLIISFIDIFLLYDYWVRSYPEHSTMFCSITGLYQLNAGSNPPPPAPPRSLWCYVGFVLCIVGFSSIPGLQTVQKQSRPLQLSPDTDKASLCDKITQGWESLTCILQPPPTCSYPTSLFPLSPAHSWLPQLYPEHQI